LNSSDFTFLLNQPDAVNERQTDALEKIISEFPYFQSARALRLKGLYSQNSFQYNYALKVTAAYTTDRSVLFDFITSDTFTTIQKGQYDQKVAELNGIEVKGSEVVESKVDVPQVDKLEQSILTSIKESGADDKQSKESFDDPTVAAELETENSPEAKISEPNEEEQNVIAIPEVEFNPYFIPEFVAVDQSNPAPESEIADENREDAIEIVPELPESETIEIEPEETGTSEHIQSELVSDFGVDENIQDEAANDVGTAEATDEIQSPEQKLHIGEPLTFSKAETHSFQEWLQLSRVQPIVRDEHISETPVVEESAPEQAVSEEPIEKSKKNQLIDRFIENNPKIPPIKQDVKPAVIEQPKEDHSALMTETLARVYLEQKKYQKAIQAYEILILKYPEKSTFFADRISEIKNLQQNNT
jgi:tetratricopeptide (TPR) repeat protein